MWLWRSMMNLMSKARRHKILGIDKGVLLLYG